MARATDPARARTIATDIVRRLRDAGHVAYFAGGCVRDELLGLAPTDYDVATDATPDRVRAIFPRSDAVGAAFGVVLVHVGAGPDKVSVEVATFRADGPYSDARRPDSIVFSDPQTDALRRDFTVNALFLDPLAEGNGGGGGGGGGLHGRVIDYVQGLDDLRARVIRAVGIADDRLAEDHLRALRAVRFAARLGFALDPSTADAIRRHAADLRGVSRERIGEEVRRMLLHPSRSAAARQLGELSLDGAIFDDRRAIVSHPRLTALPNVHAEPVPLALALAAWLADRASGGAFAPFTLTKAERLAMVGSARKVLCLSNDECDALANILIAVESIRSGWLDATASVQKRAAARGGFTEAVELIAAEEHAAENLPKTVQSTAVRVRAKLASLAATPSGLAPTPLVTGDHLVAAGLEPGPGFKTILDRLYDEQLEGRLTSHEQGMELVRRWCV